MNGTSPHRQGASAAPPTMPSELAGSSIDDDHHAEVSSCFVSSPSSSSSSSAVLDPRFAASRGTQMGHSHAQHPQVHHPHPPPSTIARPSHPASDVFPHLLSNVLDSDDLDGDDSLRVSSSTLFHDDGATATTGSNLTAPDSLVAGTTRPNHHAAQQPPAAEGCSERGASLTGGPPPHPHGEMSSWPRPRSGEERSIPVPPPPDGLDIQQHVDTQSLHSDVYECLCSPAAGSMGESESDGRGGGFSFFAPRNFKRTLANTLMERMRSRADTTSAMLAAEGDAKNAHDPHGLSTDHKKPSSPMAVLDEIEERMLRDTVLAKKRVRVVQLLIVGLVSLLFGWLGNFFVTSSCHFASSTVSVGQYSEPFAMHYGLWKYSTVDSALSGSYSCYPYHSAQHRAPVVARIANLLALLLGTYSQVCVWAYLIAGRWHPQLWRAAVYTAAVAGVLQLLTLCFFVERVCWSNHCRMGPASVVAVTTAVVWFVFAWEVHYNTPRGAESIVSLEMRDLRRASAEYMTRFQPEKAAGYYRPPEIT